MTSKERANLCAKATYMSYLFHEKNIPINLEEIIYKTEYPERLDLVINEILKIYNDKFTTKELAQIDELNNKDFVEDYFIDGYEMQPNSQGLEEVCSKKDIIYSFDTENKGDFVMEVDASHQAEIDSLLANFSNTGVDIHFQLNSDHTFQLVIHNTNGAFPEKELISMLEHSLVSARTDVDYLEGMTDEVQSSQVSFMAEHPEVFDSYVYGKERQNSFSESAQILTDAIDANDDHSILTTSPFGEYVLINENTGDKIIDSPLHDEVRDVALLTGIVHDCPLKQLGAVACEDAMDVIDTYRQMANDAGASGVDISVVDDKHDDKISVIVEKKNNPLVEPIQMYCDKDEFEETKDSLIDSMDQNDKVTNNDSFYHLFSSDGSTLTISSNLMTNENVIQATQGSMVNAVVYQKTMDVDKAAFSTPFLLLCLMVLSMVISLILLLFL